LQTNKPDNDDMMMMMMMMIPEFTYNSVVESVQENLQAKNQLDPSIRFDTILACDRDNNNKLTCTTTTAAAFIRRAWSA